MSSKATACSTISSVSVFFSYSLSLCAIAMLKFDCSPLHNFGTQVSMAFDKSVMTHSGAVTLMSEL